MRGILLVVIDCLRADHVSAYGYARPTTPTIDALASEGVLWENAFSCSSWTKPSVTSMLTGLYPSAHGSFEGVKRSRNRTAARTDRLQIHRPTLAERFTRSGWRCGAFANNAQLGRFTRLDRGFETYLPTAGKADRIIESFGEWLRADTGAPAFAYLHFLEAHWPYKPRRRHVAMFGGDRDANRFADFSARQYGEMRRAVHRGERAISDDERTHMMQMYDGAARRLDGKIKVIRGILESTGLADEFAIVVTSDHGEEFLDHGSIGHGHTLYDELIHVPLIASIPGGPSGLRVPAAVSHVDLADTLLAIGGVDEFATDRNLLAPRSSDRPVFSELRKGARYEQTIRADRWKLHRLCRFDPVNGHAEKDATPRRLFGHAACQVEYRLFDMISDPGETRDLAAEPEYLPERNDMRRRLDRWWTELDCPCERDGDGDAEIDDHVVGRLCDLGYID